MDKLKNLASDAMSGGNNNNQQSGSTSTGQTSTSNTGSAGTSTMDNTVNQEVNKVAGGMGVPSIADSTIDKEVDQRI